MTAVVPYLLVCRLRPVERQHDGGVLLDVVEMDVPLTGKHQLAVVASRLGEVDNFHFALLRERHYSRPVRRQLQLCLCRLPPERHVHIAFPVFLIGEEVDVCDGSVRGGNRLAVCIVHILRQKDVRFYAVLREVFCVVWTVDDDDAGSFELLYLSLDFDR